MDRWLCWGALGISGLFLLLFLLDLIFAMTGIPFQPFGGIDWTLDVFGMLSSALLLWLSWSALRETR
jgi:hypothetical protein